MIRSFIFIVILADAFDHERFPRPQGGQHTPTGRDEAQSSERVQNLCGKFALRHDFLFHGCACPGHEAEVEPWHPL
jgi:hypothetical protein